MIIKNPCFDGTVIAILRMRLIKSSGGFGACKMNRIFPSFFLVLCLAMCPLTLHAGSDSDWSDLFGISGLSGAARSMAVSGSDLYVGGTFDKAGSKIARYMTHWDGTEWLTMGDGFDATVNAVAVDSSGNIWAGGSFTNYGGGGGSINHIAYWNGSWNAAGGGINGTVYAIAVDPSGNVYVGGSFATVGGGTTVNNIAKWNGSSWEALGSGTVGTNARVNALAVDDGGNIYAGGYFTQAGGSSANYIAKWNGSTWSNLPGASGNGVDNIVNAITTDGTNVYAGGTFTSAGGSPAAKIAVWNTTTWSPIDGGVDDGNKVSALWFENGILYVGGDFTKVGGGTVDANYIAQWSAGPGWQALGTGMSTTVNTITKNVYAGGAFTLAGGSSAYRVARWSGSSWSVLSNASYNGLNGTVYSIAAESGNSIYAGGSFTEAGGTSVSNVAKWNGSAWSSIDNGVNGQVEVLALYGSTLYAGGSFYSAGSGAISVSNLAKYVGGSWYDVSSGTNGTVYALAVDGSGNLYVGGFFSVVGGGTSANNIAMYDGTWHALGNSLDNTVRTIHIEGSDVYAGGDFSYSGSTQVNYIAKYSGGSWSDLDSGTSGPVYTMDVYNGILYIGGLFLTVGSGPVSTVAVAGWDLTEESWSGVGTTGMDNAVYAAVASGSGVYFGGDFTTADGSSANRIVKWTGSSWEILGSGVGDILGSVYALEIGSLYVGGYFEFAGNKASYNFSKYSESAASTVLLELTLILEGPYDSSGDEMSLALNPHIPKTSPYDESVTVGSVPADAVDWIHVLLRTAVDGANVDSASAFLHPDGSVTEPGQAAGQIEFDVSEGNYYVLIEHRNHLDMISASTVYLSTDSPSTYDFTTAVTQAYNSGQKSLGSKYGMYAGDGNADGQVQNDDKNDVWWPDVGRGGYFAGDFNLDSQVQNDDKNDYWWLNVGRGSAVP